MAQLMSVARRLKPLLDRVLVEKAVTPTVSAGGILLPETTTKVRRLRSQPKAVTVIRLSFGILRQRLSGS